MEDHVVMVAPIDLQRIDRVPSSKEARDEWNAVKKWIRDEEAYDAMKRLSPEDKIEILSTKMSIHRIRNMEQKGQVEEISAEEASRATGTVRVFPAAEWEKNRYRIIKYTKTVNDVYVDGTTRLILPAENDEHAAKGRWSAQVDFRAWFDQFELAPGVRNNFVFSCAGKFFRLCRMAMGQRQSVRVAQALTTLLTSEGYRSTISTLIDNIRFVSDSRADVLHDLKLLRSRCHDCRVTVKEFTSETGEEPDLDAMITSEADFLGRRYDHRNKTVKITAKVIAKIKRVFAATEESEQPSASPPPNWSARRLACAFGLLYYATDIIKLPPCKYFNAIAAYGQLEAQAYAQGIAGDFWDQRAAIDSKAWKELLQWRADALQNKERSLKAPTRHATIITDGSGWGWGAVAFLEGYVKTFSVPWSQHDTLNRDVSAETETEAVARAVCCCIDPSVRTTVAIWTDATAAVAGLSRQGSKSEALNRVLFRLTSLFPLAEFKPLHIKGGDLNPADVYSRGGASRMGERQLHGVWGKKRRVERDKWSCSRGWVLGGFSPLLNIRR